MGSPLSSTSVITRWAIVTYHHRTSTGWIVSIMGCTSTSTRTNLLVGFALPAKRYWEMLSGTTGEDARFTLWDGTEAVPPMKNESSTKKLTNY
jgi:hypothetical protein